MDKVRIWDLPTRLFHWTLVALIAFSWWSGKSGHFDWHIWSGLGILTLLIFRILWGFFGSSTARFAGFLRGPGQIPAYLQDIKGWRPIGLSPLGAISAVVMLAAIAVQVGLGLFAVDEDGLNEGPLAQLVSLDLSEKLTDLHEDWFNILLVLIGLHIAAIVYYRLFFGKRLVGPMITGKGDAAHGVEPMQSGRPSSALLCLIASVAITCWVKVGAPPFGG